MNNQIIICAVLLIASCSKTDECVPRTVDGAWETVGIKPPNPESIAENLIGMDRQQLSSYLGAPYQSNSEEKLWIYERRRKAEDIDCKSKSKVTWMQSFFLVKAKTDRDGRAISCRLKIKQHLSSELLSRDKVAQMAPGPLDGDETLCARTKTGKTGVRVDFPDRP